jgi:O-methyltransferase
MWRRPGPPRRIPICGSLIDPEFERLYRGLQNKTQTSVPMSYALRNATNYVMRAGIPGDIVECGVGRGGSAAIAAATLVEGGGVGRDIWLYDTFRWEWDSPSGEDGLLLPSGKVGLADVADTASDSTKADETDRESVLSTICGTGYPRERVHCIEGFVQETLPEHAPDRIAILRLDTDLYLSTMHELQHLYPRVSSRGVLILDDYGKFAGGHARCRRVLRGARGTSSTPSN